MGDSAWSSSYINSNNSHNNKKKFEEKGTGCKIGVKNSRKTLIIRHNKKE